MYAADITILNEVHVPLTDSSDLPIPKIIPDF